MDVGLQAHVLEPIVHAPESDDRAQMVAVPLVGNIMFAMGQPPQAGNDAANLKITHPDPAARHGRGARGQRCARSLSDEAQHNSCERTGGASGERSQWHGVPRHCTWDAML